MEREISIKQFSKKGSQTKKVIFGFGLTVLRTAISSLPSAISSLFTATSTLYVAMPSLPVTMPT